MKKKCWSYYLSEFYPDKNVFIHLYSLSRRLKVNWFLPLFGLFFVIRVQIDCKISNRINWDFKERVQIWCDARHVEHIINWEWKDYVQIMKILRKGIGDFKKYSQFLNSINKSKHYIKKQLFSSIKYLTIQFFLDKYTKNI